ncbi:hypothetical protein Cgig2_032487 [Carnegiea gigantea]|uniref:Uncharacterized protein n=1 Tax=Carnegiea gigantea TaxID=171969 RepID=A0A9Q1KWH6_9CARY|nr:hypothetical protein Cgig2_032487 [Carnegiea gigantea]
MVEITIANTTKIAIGSKKIDDAAMTLTIVVPANHRAYLISKGKISLGKSHPNGPHDHAKAETYMQMKSTTTMAYHWGKSDRWVTAHPKLQSCEYGHHNLQRITQLVRTKSIKHDDVDSSQLLKERNDNSHGEMGPILPLQEVPPWVLDFLGCLTGCHEVIELFFYIIYTSDFLESGDGLILHSTLNEGVRGVRKD